MQDEGIKIGSGIKLMRVSSGMSIAELSRSTGLSSSYLWRIENGKRLPSTTSIRKIANQLGGFDFYRQLIAFLN